MRLQAEWLALCIRSHSRTGWSDTSGVWDSDFYTAEATRKMWVDARSPNLVRSSRQLETHESKRVWEGITQNWGIEDFARPRPKGKKSFHHMVVQTFEAWPFHPDEDGNVCDLLRLALVTRGASRIYELRENHHADHEIEAEAIEPVYWGGWEGIWTDDTFEWLVYADHESAVTVAGGGLLADLKDVWPDWRKCVYHET